MLEAERDRIASNPRERLIATIKSRIPLALGILAGILLMPVAIKALFYFVLAPLASRLRADPDPAERRCAAVHASRHLRGLGDRRHPAGR